MTTEQDIRVFVADDHSIIRDGLARILDATEGISCAGTAESGQEVLTAWHPKAGWDVLILDLSLPGGGEATLERLQALAPGLPVLIFSMHPEDQYAIRLLKAGAAGYLNKGRPSTELLQAIRTVARGKKYITQDLAALLLETGPDKDSAPHELLTPREYQIFMLLLEGKLPQDIVAELHVSASTVSTHIHHIKQKLNAPSIVDLVKYAYRIGLLS